MNRKGLLIGAATIPFFLMAVVFQAIQYQDLHREVAQKEQQQFEWVEKNKKVLAGVTVLRSPQRIETLAARDPGLQSVGADRTVKVQFQVTSQTPGEANGQPPAPEAKH